MPELPDVEVYVDCLRRRILGQTCNRVRIASPFVLRTVTPAPTAVEGRVVESVQRLGKGVVIGFAGFAGVAGATDELFIVIHLMIAGRLRWRDGTEPVPSIPKKQGLAALDFPAGTVIVTEAGSTKRASLHVVQGEMGLRAHDRGGLEPLSTDFDTFATAIRRENHTLKRALTDPRLLSGIGNTYSDEILHAAQLSPLALTRRLTDAELERLYDATTRTLAAWVARLRAEVGNGFPEKVTAFREGMAVHGRYRKPCPVCGSPVQRIVYANNEVNYCATCQTNGRLLADRSLSRLLKSDWPRSIDALETT